MQFKIIWSDAATRQLSKLDRSIAKRIFNIVSKLERDPSRWISKIVKSPYYKLRVGDYRAIIDIDKKELKISILKVGHRKTIYKKLPF